MYVSHFGMARSNFAVRMLQTERKKRNDVRQPEDMVMHVAE